MKEFITLRKLANLNNSNRIKKTAEIIEHYEREITEKGKISRTLYLTRLMRMLEEFTGKEAELFHSPSAIESSETHQLLRALNRIKSRLYSTIAVFPSDWTIKENKHDDRPSRLLLPFSVYIDDIRSPYNLGSIFRSADAFGVSNIILSPDSPDPAHPRCRRTSMGTWDRIPWQRNHLNCLEEKKNVFCLELGGIPVAQFLFPPSGTVIIGNEEHGISKQGIEIAEKSSGVVSIPMAGFKASLNVSASFAVLMSWWFNKSFIKNFQ
ncbi:MAG: TrmH family RNA methyltransferase [Spirochaetia bacterium]